MIGKKFKEFEEFEKFRVTCYVLRVPRFGLISQMVNWLNHQQIVNSK